MDSESITHEAEGRMGWSLIFFSAAQDSCGFHHLTNYMDNNDFEYIPKSLAYFSLILFT